MCDPLMGSVTSGNGLGDPLSKDVLGPLQSLIKGHHGPAPPPPRSLQEEIQRILGVMQDVQPQVSAVSGAYDRGEAQNLADTYSQIVGPLSRQLSAQANTSQRSADVSDVQNLGPAAVQAILNADPQQKAARDAANQGAMSQYAMGNQFDPADARRIVQQVRGEQSGRGFGQGSDNDLLSQALQLGMSGEGLRQQRFQNLGSVMQSNQQQTGDPFMAVLGRPGQSLGFAQGAYGQASARTPNSDPFQNQYAQDLNNTNFNAAYANVFSQRNADAANRAAIYGLLGSVIGAGGAVGAKAI